MSKDPYPCTCPATAPVHDKECPSLKDPHRVHNPNHALVDDFKVGDTWHRAGCDGNCAVAFGCAAQWHEEEILAMVNREQRPPLVLNRILRAKTSAERKGEPVYDGVLMYFPDALAAVSRVSRAGNDKHNPGQPLHWARGKSTDQMNCVVRHSLTPEELDADTGEVELAHAAWRILAQLQLIEEARLVKMGVKPYSGVVS